ncbi:hypothetical protein FDP41_003444 [Naegleria fowleri]|uniref:Pentacotripeptide-repeat region of PRORP domain-containing protein n=1 Tax=Naegleria fowleri TaxID=5763 RepID=A0A6A5BRY3_NAEFO|nr:uncharacterized protein FDP41_003444 [Naegleria fowleri]KAF0977452.1 hypothetical protein FDP41_003444 [Naegleria fowleri]
MMKFGSSVSASWLLMRRASTGRNNKSVVSYFGKWCSAHPPMNLWLPFHPIIMMTNEYHISTNIQRHKKLSSSPPTVKQLILQSEKKKETSDGVKLKKKGELTYTPEEKSKYFQQIIFPLRKALKEKDIDKCIWYFEKEAPKYFVSIPLEESNEYLNLLAGVGNFRKAFEYYSKLFEKCSLKGGTKPDINTIEILFFAAKQNRDLPTLRVLKKLEIVIFEDLNVLKLKVNSKILHDLIAVLVYGIRNNESKNHNELMAVLRGEAIDEKLSKFTPDTMIELYNNTKHKSKFVHTYMVQYLHLIGKFEQIFIIYDELKKEEKLDALDIKFYNALLMSLINHRFSTHEDVLFMFEIYREIVEVGGCQPTCHTFNMILSALKTANEKQLFISKEEYREKVSGLFKEIKFRLNPADIDPPLLNLLSQSLSFVGMLKESRDLISAQPLNITPLTVQYLLRKSIIKECETLNDFKANIQPLLALLLDKAYEMKPELLNFLVLRMLETHKSHKVIEALCEYCLKHFGLRVTIDPRAVDKTKQEFVFRLSKINI